MKRMKWMKKNQKEMNKSKKFISGWGKDDKWKENHWQWSEPVHRKGEKVSSLNKKTSEYNFAKRNVWKSM